MQPTLKLLDNSLVTRILDEAFQLLLSPGVKVQSAEARQLLAQAGATDIQRLPFRGPTDSGIIIGKKHKS